MASYSPGSGRQSSISSVRRLIAVVRSTPSRLGPVYSRRLLCRNLAALCLGHAVATAALAPLLALHGSSAARLLALLFSLAAVSSAASPLLLRHQPAERRLLLGYCSQCLFFGAHLYPHLYTLLPAYFLMGITLGPLTGARITLLMTLASKLYADEEEQTGERVLVVQRLLRGLRAAHDVGLVAGNTFASLLLWKNAVAATTTTATEDATDMQHLVCGSVACPGSGPTSSLGHTSLPCRIDTVLAGVFLGCCVTAVALTGVFTDRIEPTAAAVAKSRDALKRLRLAFVDPRLRLAAPLSLFVGLEQGFMYADFTESYVVCALGIESVPMVFLSLGILQSIAGFTLSMLLQHVRRYLIIGMGCAFHSCLLMVLFLWKPAGDDPALFYVIAAAWGVCNAVWDTLSFGLVMSAYPDSWQAPVAHSYFFRFSGLAVAFGLHGAVCNRFKLYGLAGALVLAVAPYTWMEMKEVRRPDNR